MKLNLQQLKQIVRISDYLGTREKEKDFFIHSPFRAEKTPSFKIKFNRNKYCIEILKRLKNLHNNKLFNRNKYCIEIGVLFLLFIITKTFNRNKYCIEIF